jgi:hypothetical protein
MLKDCVTFPSPTNPLMRSSWRVGNSRPNASLFHPDTVARLTKSVRLLIDTSLGEEGWPSGS